MMIGLAQELINVMKTFLDNKTAILSDKNVTSKNEGKTDFQKQQEIDVLKKQLAIDLKKENIKLQKIFQESSQLINLLDGHIKFYQTVLIGKKRINDPKEIQKIELGIIDIENEITLTIELLIKILKNSLGTIEEFKVTKLKRTFSLVYHPDTYKQKGLTDLSEIPQQINSTINNIFDTAINLISFQKIIFNSLTESFKKTLQLPKKDRACALFSKYEKIEEPSYLNVNIIFSMILSSKLSREILDSPYIMKIINENNKEAIIEFITANTKEKTPNSQPLQELLKAIYDIYIPAKNIKYNSYIPLTGQAANTDFFRNKRDASTSSENPETKRTRVTNPQELDNLTAMLFTNNTIPADLKKSLGEGESSSDPNYDIFYEKFMKDVC